MILIGPFTLFGPFSRNLDELAKTLVNALQLRGTFLQLKLLKYVIFSKIYYSRTINETIA